MDPRIARRTKSVMKITTKNSKTIKHSLHIERTNDGEPVNRAQTHRANTNRFSICFFGVPFLLFSCAESWKLKISALFSLIFSSSLMDFDFFFFFFSSYTYIWVFHLVWAALGSIRFAIITALLFIVWLFESRYFFVCWYNNNYNNDL